MTVTSDAIMGYLECKYKAYLTIHGETGIKSDYHLIDKCKDIVQ